MLGDEGRVDARLLMLVVKVELMLVSEGRNEGRVDAGL